MRKRYDIGMLKTAAAETQEERLADIHEEGDEHEMVTDAKEIHEDAAAMDTGALLLDDTDGEYLVQWDQHIHHALQCKCENRPLPNPMLPECAWDVWLWKTDPQEPCHIDMLLNRCQAMGLLLARYRAVFQKRFWGSRNTLAQHIALKTSSSCEPRELLNTHRMLFLFRDKPVSQYTLRELRDEIQNLQLHWVEHNAVDIPGIMEGVDALFHRFGVLASIPEKVDIMNDQGSIEDFVVFESDGGDNKKLFQMNRICLRRFINVFLMFYRHMHLHDTCTRIEMEDDEAQKLDCCINIHHAIAAEDDFSKLAMHWHLMPSARLNYVHDFPGMYNCISQVVYFHNPKYERPLQERKDVAGLSAGRYDGSQIIPCLMQLYPQIDILHDDECFDPGMDADSHKWWTPHRRRRWAWIIAGKRVYLMSPSFFAKENNKEEEGAVEVYYHENVVALLNVFLKRKHLFIEHAIG